MRRALIVLFSTVCLAGSAFATDYAFVVFKADFCDDPAASMDVSWYYKKYASSGSLHLFQFDESTFNPVSSGDQISRYDKIVAAAHGDTGSIGDSTASEFADAFAGAHANAPDEVYFIACESAAVPTGGPSVVGALAAKYPSGAAGSTQIKKITGTKLPCALRPPGNEAIKDLKLAVYYQNIKQAPQAAHAESQILSRWADDKYPGSHKSFQAYCESMKVSDTLNFVNQVYKSFDTAYIGLINYNSGGQPPDVCGADNRVACK